MSQRLIASAVFGWTLANAATNSARGNFHYLLGKEPSQWRVNVQPTADPRNTSVSYATLLRGTKSDHAAAVVADASGNFYVTGWTYSADFPVTPSAFKGTFTDLSPKTANAFVAKFDPAGALIYCTYVGGNRDDKANSIAVDHDGNAYITGQTASLDFPTTSGAIVANLADSYSVGVFVLKLSPAGDRLVYSTLLSDGYYVGDKGAAIAVDAAGNAVVTGTNNSEQFATTAGAATERSYGNFVAKELSRNKLSNMRVDTRMNLVVPFAMEFVAMDVDAF